MKPYFNVIRLFFFVLLFCQRLDGWSSTELMELKTISDVQLSPDNQIVLFVVTKNELSKNKSISEIYKADPNSKESPTIFLAGKGSYTQPRWSPNGEWIAFLYDCDGVKNLHLMNYNVGKTIALTNAQTEVQTFSWSPDSQKIAYVMEDEMGWAKNQKNSSLAYVYKQATSINRLWVVDVFAFKPMPKALTSDEYSVRGYGDFGTINTEFDWSPDGKTITFAYSPMLGFDSFHLDSHIASVDLETEKITEWEKKASYEAMPKYSPDGCWVAYMKSDGSKRYANNKWVGIRSVDGKQDIQLAPTFNEGPYLFGQNLLGWSMDGNHVLFYEPKGTKSHIVMLSTDGRQAKEMSMGENYLREPVLSSDRSLLGFVGQSTGSPPEVYVANLTTFSAAKISDLNQAFLSYPKIKTEVIQWRSVDGLSIEGLLTYPINYQPGQRYPLLLMIHGGPMASFDETYVGGVNYYPIALFAESGFLIFRPNPRGSCGYGKSFRIANYGDWGGLDYQDLIAGVDFLIAKGVADSEKLGVMGWSYGGYMTAWIVTQTNRFKAASIGAGLSNLVSAAGTTDLHRFLIDYLGDFSDNLKLYEERSPINYARNVITPCLIQHGAEDRRVPISQSYEFYHALDRAGKKPTLVIYPGMGHRLSEPKMQLDAMERNLAWFKQHLIKNIEL